MIQMVKVLDPHRCYCGNNLTLIEEEINTTDLNSKGQINRGKTKHSTVEYLYCKRCGERFPYYAIITDETLTDRCTIDRLRAEELKAERLNKIIDNNNIRMIPRSNPFYND